MRAQRQRPSGPHKNIKNINTLQKEISLKKVLFLVLAFIALIIIVCPKGKKETTTSKSYTETKQQYSGITEAGSKIKSKVNLALRNKFTVKDVYVKKSNQHSNSYYVGAIFIVENTPLVGIWITNATEEKEGQFFSVNSFAKEFSQLPLLPNETLVDGKNPDTRALESYLKNRL